MRVVVERVSKVYADRAGHTVQALDGIDLSVDAEEFVAVLGPSGCGKSTLLNLIPGLLAPTEGAIWLDSVARVVVMDALRTRSEDVEFHRSRRMFCPKDGEVKIAPEGTTMSHLEWFEAEGWITEDAQPFMTTTVRGAFIPTRHALFLYRGLGFFYDDDLIEEAGRRAGDLMAALALDADVAVHVGPVDAVVRGTRYPQRRLGTLGSLIANG